MLDVVTLLAGATRALASIMESTEYLSRDRLIILAMIDIEAGAEIAGALPFFCS
jgi:hypothetical protein